VWGRVVGLAAARRAAPVWGGVAIAAMVIFGGTGMHAADLTGAALGSAGVATGLFALWMILMAPVGAAMVDPRPTAYLRALPWPRAWRWAVGGAIATAVQGPWTLLWAVGEGASAAVVATAVAAAAMLAVASIPWPAPRRAPRWRGPVRALVGAHGRAVVRRRGTALARGAALAALGGAVAGLVARANALSAAEALVVVLVAASVALPMAIGALAAPVAESDRDLGWVLASTGCSRGARVVAQVVALAGAGAAFGAGLGALMALFGAPSPAILVGAAAAHGAALGALSLRVAVWATLTSAVPPVIDGDRIVIGMLGAAVASVLALAAIGPTGVAVLAVTALALVAPLASRQEAR